MLLLLEHFLGVALPLPSCLELATSCEAMPDRLSSPHSILSEMHPCFPATRGRALHSHACP